MSIRLLFAVVETANNPNAHQMVLGLLSASPAPCPHSLTSLTPMVTTVWFHVLKKPQEIQTDTVKEDRSKVAWEDRLGKHKDFKGHDRM